MQSFGIKQFDAFLNSIARWQFNSLVLSEYKFIGMSRYSYSINTWCNSLVSVSNEKKHQFKRRLLMSFVQRQLGITGLLLIMTTRREGGGPYSSP